jgi:KaiC/GvpD/RAD55 family RecA-like ATPase
MILLAFFAVTSLHVGIIGADVPSASNLVTIQVPVLKNPVIIDGKLTSPTEWADASRNNVTLNCYTGYDVSCNNAIRDDVQTTIFTKHDDKWIYFFYEVYFLKQFAPPCPNADLCPKAYAQYCWSASGSSPWKACDKVLIGFDEHGGSYIDDLYINATAPGVSDVDLPGGQRNVVGTANYDGTFYYRFEFRKMLDSGDGYDWSLKAGHTYGVGIPTDGLFTVAFGRADYHPMYGYDVALALCPCAPPITSTTAATSTTGSLSTGPAVSNKSIQPQTTPGGQAPFVQLPLSTLAVIGIVALVISVAILAVVMRRKKVQPPVSLTRASVTEVVPPSEIGISSGYPDLDRLLVGGLPEGYAILILSASWDERNLLLRRIIESFIHSGRHAFYVSNDISTCQELARRFTKDFWAYSAFAEKAPSPHGNLRQIPGVGILSEFSISLTTSLKERVGSQDTSRLLILDILSDVLIRHKTLTTVRWLSDLIARRKIEKFTIMATLNSSIAPKEETQPIFDLFDGVIEIYERALGERTRRFLVIKKMHGRRYLDEDLMLDRDRLY